MKIILLFFVLIICCEESSGQQCNATGASINYGLQILKNIKTNFGAVGDGNTNDHEAFKAAALFINQNGGNVKLIIPDGIYIVGNQINNIGNEINNVPVYAGETVLEFSSISNVSIIGSAFSTIIFKDQMKFGTFDPSTGLCPVNLDLYNPSCCPSTNNPPPTCTTGINCDNAYKYRYTGVIGNFITMTNCYNFEIRNLEINGNSDKYILGGNWGLGSRPIEHNNNYGLYLKDVYNSTFKNLKIHHFGVDNLCLRSSFISSGDTILPKSKNIILDSIFCEYAGRNNFSWTGGKNICILNSSFNHAANKTIKTKPGYGMDIEPEGDIGHTLCTDGFFYNSVFGDNNSMALTTGRSIDNPIYNNDIIRGYSYNHYFNRCILIGRFSSTTHNYINRVTFDSCNFYGQVINYGSSVDDKSPAIFKNSYFSDCYNGDRMYDKPLLTIQDGYKMKISNCVFDKYFSSGKPSWIYNYGTSVYDCEEDNYKPIFENSTFNFFEPHDNQIKILSVGRQTKFFSNIFYKDESNNLVWSNPTGCSPNSEGNVDLGYGLQYQTWPFGYNYPNCSNQKICEENIYISTPLYEAKKFISKDFIYVDSQITLSNDEIVFQAQNYIQLNPGFDSNLSGLASMDIKIGNCSVEEKNLNPQRNISETLFSTVRLKSKN